MSQFPNAPSDYPNAGFASESSAMDQSLSTWPRTLGIISLIYAIIGLLCGLSGSAWFLLFEQKMNKLQFGVEVPPPQVVYIKSVVGSIVMLLLGILLLVGAINLLKRKSIGVKLLKFWAMIRILLLVVFMGVAIVTVKADIQYQHAKEDAAKAAMAGSGSGKNAPPKFPFSDDTFAKIIIGSAAVMILIIAIYPTIVMIYLSRRKITDEVAHWDLPATY